MTNLDDIFNAEKARNYSLDDKDQFVFDTLTAISTTKAQRLKQFAIALSIVFGFLVLGIQLLFLTFASFDNLVGQTELLMTQKPYLLALINILLIGAVMMLKRVRFF